MVAPGKWFYTPQVNPFQQQAFNPFFGNQLGMFGMQGGMFGMMGQQFGNMGGNFGMMGAGAPPVPVSQGGPADIQTANTIEFFPPALALIVRAPSRIHTSVTGGLIGGKAKREVQAKLDAENRGLDRVGAGGKILVAGNQGADKNKGPKTKPLTVPIDTAKDADLDPTKIWNEALAKGDVEPGMVIATADFLFETGHFLHAAEFLKANLRYGIVVRPWVYESLAVALEASGDPDGARRARLSAVSLDPSDANGFLQAARTMAEDKQYDRALAFCRQAALLEPNLALTYADALAYAEHGKDSKSMEWAVGKLLSQDWPSDNQDLHLQAQTRLQTLAQTLQREKRGTEADRLRLALQNLRQRDLIVNLTWDTGSEPADLELEVKEPTGSVCSSRQKQTPGGGTFLGTDLLHMTKASYTAAKAFAGEYEVKVRRLFGQPLGGRAKLEIIQNYGTAKETRKLEIIRLDQNAAFKVNLKAGRRTELASVSPVQPKRQDNKEEAAPTMSVLAKLRGIAHPDFSGASPRGGAGTPGSHLPMAPSRAGKMQTQQPAYQSAVTPLAGVGVNLTAQVQLSPGQDEANLVLRPIFQTVAAGQRPAVNLPLIPGAGQ